MPLSKILVPLDGSSLAEKALPTAIALARTSAATVCLVMVDDGKNVAEKRDEAETYFAATARSLVESEQATCHHTVSGDAAKEIVEIAREEEVDLIVMATHGRSGIARTALGSVTDAVIRNAHAPVFVTRSETAAQSTYADGLAAQIIVPLDGSELAETALDEAVQLARACQSPIHLLRVMDEHAKGVVLGQAEAYLDQIVDRLAGQEIHAVPELMTGDPGRAIEKAMNETEGSLVVLTTRGASGFVRWRRGSVADWLIRNAPGPVVVVSPKEQALLGQVIH